MPLHEGRMSASSLLTILVHMLKIHFSREYSDVLALPMRNSTSAWFLWGPQMFVVRVLRTIKDKERNYRRA